MKKNQFRMISKAARGVMMVVAESVKSNTTSANLTTSSSAKDCQTRTVPPETIDTIRPFVFSFLLALGLAVAIIYIAPAYVDIVAD